MNPTLLRLQLDDQPPLNLDWLVTPLIILIGIGTIVVVAWLWRLGHSLHDVTEHHAEEPVRLRLRRPHARRRSRRPRSRSIT
ncbi:hypothetical protein OVN18_09445 [Microcella daejeonensis]|uniref:Uncharacterized protein n=1 Tax=Microcella daejeonensis TaxID=2994971 RepID=A0A9E8MJP1_9MICO|nr:hypothetical protein [Microcella daejeonensis]WAB80789.1 hypothetical protein OVN18_09445 [Microcella daejeonensis]